MPSTLPPGQLFALESLVTPTAQGIASRVLARSGAGNLTLFAFDAGEELSEHTAPFDALALTLSGALRLTIGGVEVRTAPQTIVLMPANVPHAVRAEEASRMLLVMLREPAAGCSAAVTAATPTVLVRESAPSPVNPGDTP